MKNKKRLRALVAGVGIFILAGCSTPNNTDTNREIQNKDTHMEDNITEPDDKDIPDGNDTNADGSIDGGEIIASSDLQGSVIEFSEDGCTINPVTNSDDGSTAVIAAEGYEEEGEKVAIKYGDNCTFQRAVISITTGKATVSEVTKADIKKKTSLLLYGNFDDTENFTATKVVITQYKQEE